MILSVLSRMSVFNVLIYIMDICRYIKTRFGGSVGLLFFRQSGESLLRHSGDCNAERGVCSSRVFCALINNKWAEKEQKMSKEHDHSKYALWIDPNEVVPYERNAKIHTEKQVKNIANSISRFGWQQDCVLTTDNVLVIGHGRQMAAIELGCEMPYHVVDKTADELTDEDIRELRIADNQTNAETGLDFGTLEIETADLDFDGFDFDFGLLQPKSWFDRVERDGTAREHGNDEYNEYLDKFEQKKTTDDCYTPDVVYEAVADWVANEYGVSKKDFVRPFYPGGDYQKEKYKSGAVVVDNPPFSILAEIVKYYSENKIRFFLFAPTLTLFSSSSCALCIGVTITYENGASVNTSFLTNLEEGMRLRSAPSLYAVVKAANDANLKEMRRELPKYSYPDYVITSTRCGQFSRYGIDYRVPVSESYHIRQLDAQKATDKSVFGSAYLVSERLKAEREKAEREKAERWERWERWELSDREMEIVKSLG